MLYGPIRCRYGIKQRTVLILIFLENALRPTETVSNVVEPRCLNPYFFGKCSTAPSLKKRKNVVLLSLNPYFFGKCSTALKIKNQMSEKKAKAENATTVQVATETVSVLILIFLENALRLNRFSRTC